MPFKGNFEKEDFHKDIPGELQDNVVLSGEKEIVGDSIFSPGMLGYLIIICSGPVYTIPFSFHIGLGKAIRYENFSCLHDAVFSS